MSAKNIVLEQICGHLYFKKNIKVWGYIEKEYLKINKIGFQYKHEVYKKVVINNREFPHMLDNII